jgi:hypothetical protein
MVEYKKFLAEKVLNEKEPVSQPLGKHGAHELTLDQVTYRSLSRALNVHSNLSKQYVINGVNVY